MFFFFPLNCQQHQKKLTRAPENYLHKHYILNRSKLLFSLKQNRTLCSAFCVQLSKTWMGTLSQSHEYTKGPNKNRKKTTKKTHENEKRVSAERNGSLLIKGRFKHILNIFKQRPSWWPLIHPSSSTFGAGSCCWEVPVQKGGPGGISLASHIPGGYGT